MNLVNNENSPVMIDLFVILINAVHTEKKKLQFASYLTVKSIENNGVDKL